MVFEEAWYLSETRFNFPQLISMADNLIQQDIDKFYRSFITEIYRNLGFVLGGIFIYIYIYPEFKGMYVRDLQEGKYYF